MPGKKYRSIKHPRCYEKLKPKYGKSKAAAICNAVAAGTINRRRKGRR